MKIEQRIDPGAIHRTNMPQDVGRIGVVALRLEIEIESLKTVGDRPAK